MPSKVSSGRWLKRWSKRMESARKPSSECIFGVMKKRILDVGCSFKKVTEMDNVFFFSARYTTGCCVRRA